MNVLLSIKPRFAEGIFSGDKKFEFRKKIFARHDIEKVFVYASSPTKSVIGEFEIDRIIHKELNALWAETKNMSGISEESFFKYFEQNLKGYAIKIKNQKKYVDPLSLNSFFVSTPPQSYRYIENVMLGVE
jgi:predicted transcriptional regulator